MELKFKISCTCDCEYTLNEKISTDKIFCPNCGMEYPNSAKLISILNTAKGISEGSYLSNEVVTRVIPTDEYMKKPQ